MSTKPRSEKAKIDFESINRELCARCPSLLHEWLPGGTVSGREYKCGSIQGGRGQSFSVNMESGIWKDFAIEGDKGGDLISLYARIKNVPQGEAAKQFSSNRKLPSRPIKSPASTIVKPPAGTPPPDFKGASHTYEYKDAQGETLFYIARYETPEGKTFRPYSWDSKTWVNRGFNTPRPLYGLETLRGGTTPALVVEGERTCDAARELASRVYDVVTWPGGAQALKYADWTPLHGRKILLWPDADAPGIAAVKEIAQFLYQHCPEVKVLDVSGMPPGWDAADSGFTWETFKEWAKPRASLFVPSIEELKTEVYTKPSTINDAPLIEPPPPTDNDRPHITINVTDPEDLDLSSQSFIPLYQNLGVSMTQSGSAICNIDNVLRILEGEKRYRDCVWFDEFYSAEMTGSPPREWTDRDDLLLTAELQRKYGLRRITDAIVHSAVKLCALRDRRNEPKQWMESLVWDNTPRVDAFFISSMGVDISDYTLAVGRSFWLSMVARVMQPGCKADTMVILEGPQGAFKSSAMRIIGGKWFTESSQKIGSDEFKMAMHGNILVEIGELGSFNKVEMTKIKQTLTDQVDAYRPKYGRRVIKFPRSCVFVGTTNESVYIDDPTGARRFLPLKTFKIDKDYIGSNRDQLFAEAVARFKAGEQWWVQETDTVKEEQALRQNEDSWIEAINTYFTSNGSRPVTVKELALNAIELALKDITKSEEMRISRILHKMGMVKRQIRLHGTRPVMWCSRDYHE